MQEFEQNPQVPGKSHKLHERISRWGGVGLLLGLALFLMLRTGRSVEEPVVRQEPAAASPTVTATSTPEISKLAIEEGDPASGIVGRPTPVISSDAVQQEPSCAIITEDRVHLREGPAGAIRAIGNTGLPVMLLVERHDAEGIRWAKIRLDAVERWVAEQYVQPMPCD